MTTIYTLFRGGNGVGVGAEAAGIAELGGVEYDKDIASVADMNFPHAPTTIADIREVDPALLACGAPDILHASPSCRTASTANQNAEVNEDGLKETQEDKESGLAVCRFLRNWTPRYFTLENVWKYREYEAFGYITHTLRELGYSYDFWHLNAADYGVPQTRRRLILLARRGKGQRIIKPIPTHHAPADEVPDQISMFEPVTRSWVGWYEAIADLIPTLPESQFAKWQLARLPEEIKCFISPGVTAWTPPADATEPIFTIQSSGHNLQARAFIVDGQPSDNGQVVTIRDGHEPIFTMNASQDKKPLRAFLVGVNGQGGDLLYSGDEPSQTISANHGSGKYRAVLIDGDGNRSRTPTVLNDNVPSLTIQAWHGRRPSCSPRAWLSQGRVVSMTPRALARFQSFPDTYKLPESKKLAYKVIGNAVPPLLYQKVISYLIAS